MQRPRAKVFRIIVQICRFGLAALFLFTAGAKLWIVKAFAANVAELLAAIGIQSGSLDVAGNDCGDRRRNRYRDFASVPAARFARARCWRRRC